MILLCGIPSEMSLGLVIEKVRELGEPHVIFNQRRFEMMDLEYRIENGQVVGTMQYEGQTYPLEQFKGVYIRLMEYRHLPELANETEQSPKWMHSRSLHDALMRWYELSSARVVNRNVEIGSNFSKPYQAQLIQPCGFKTPETLITNDPDAVRAFYEQHQRIIYKSVSSVRSIVQTLEPHDFERLDHILSCPTQFQKYIDGENIRVHTVGRQLFATKISTTATDYRYAYLQGEREVLSEAQLPDELQERCLQLSEALGLGFAGIDLKVTKDDGIYCLEVNPCPAFSYYEQHTGQPISMAVAKHLAGLD